MSLVAFRVLGFLGALGVDHSINEPLSHTVSKLLIITNPKNYYVLRFYQHTPFAFLARNVPPDLMMPHADGIIAVPVRIQDTNVHSILYRGPGATLDTRGWLLQGPTPTTSPSGDLIPTIRESGAHPGRGLAIVLRNATKVQRRQHSPSFPTSTRKNSWMLHYVFASSWRTKQTTATMCIASFSRLWMRGYRQATPGSTRTNSNFAGRSRSGYSQGPATPQLFDP